MRCADHALEYRKLADIKPYQKNPRKNDKAVTAVANSIREYGFQSPIPTKWASLYSPASTDLGGFYNGRKLCRRQKESSCP